MKLIAFAASLRKDSHNGKLIAIAARQARELGAEITEVDYATLVTPNYSFDEQQDAGFPEGAERLKALLADHDGVLLSSPEYNYSIPGALKNTLDWLSRYRPSPLSGKHVYLLSASPSMVGGNRGLWATRIPLEVGGAHVYPSMFSLAVAHEAFDDAGGLKDEALRKFLVSDLTGFIELVTRVKG